MKKDEIIEKFKKFLPPDKEIDKMFSTTEEFAYLRLSQIFVPEQQIREKIDDTSLSFLSLVESIKQKGILEPLLVTKNKEDDRYQLVAGFRRFLAAKQVGLESVPVRILPSVAQDEKILIQMIENIVREGLSVVEMAESFSNYYSTKHQGKSLLSDLVYYRRKPDKLTEEEKNTILHMLSIIGKKSRTLSNMLDLLTLPREILTEIKRKNIPISAGYLLVRFFKRNPEKRESVVNKIIKNQKKYSLKEIQDILHSL